MVPLFGLLVITINAAFIFNTFIGLESLSIGAGGGGDFWLFWSLTLRNMVWLKELKLLGELLK